MTVGELKRLCVFASELHNEAVALEEDLKRVMAEFDGKADNDQVFSLNAANDMMLGIVHARNAQWNADGIVNSFERNGMTAADVLKLQCQFFDDSNKRAEQEHTEELNSYIEGLKEKEANGH